MTLTFLCRRFVRSATAAVAVAVTATAVTAQQGATYEVVSTFDPASGRPTGVIQTPDGQLFGTTASLSFGDVGTIFTMDAAGSRTTLHTFHPSDGSPFGKLFAGTDGSVYGTTYVLSSFVGSPGQIFMISSEGLFTTVASGVYRMNGVIQARDRRLYGTAAASPSALFPCCERLFRVEPDGTLTGVRGGIDVFNPVAELVEIDDGSLYGTGTANSSLVPPAATLGEIFQLVPNPTTGEVIFRTRYSFNGPDGSSPTGRLIQGIDGLIYGTTSAGGAFGFGTVFSLDAAGTLTTLHHFSGSDGANPNAGVTQGFDGRLYGVTSRGGTFGYGTVFVMNVTGGLTTVHDFALSDGANPVNEVIQANDGAFYGAAPSGGPQGGGVVFRVRLGTTPRPSDGYFEIVSRNSDKCLDVFGASTDPAAQVTQWTCHGGPNQQWRLEPAGGGAVRIIARHSGQALDVFGALLDDVTPIIQWPVHGGDNQAWTFEPAGDGYVRLVVRHSGKAMDVEFASTDDGARVIQYMPHDGANQQWLLRHVE